MGFSLLSNVVGIQSNGLLELFCHNDKSIFITNSSLIINNPLVINKTITLKTLDNLDYYSIRGDTIGPGKISNVFWYKISENTSKESQPYKTVNTLHNDIITLNNGNKGNFHIKDNNFIISNDIEKVTINFYVTAGALSGSGNDTVIVGLSVRLYYGYLNGVTPILAKEEIKLNQIDGGLKKTSVNTLSVTMPTTRSNDSLLYLQFYVSHNTTGTDDAWLLSIHDLTVQVQS